MAKQVDKNLIIQSKIKKEGMKFYDVNEAPFAVYGVWYDTDRFYRVPREVAVTVSPSIVQKSDQTAGGRVRFKTNSPYVAVKAEIHNTEEISVMTALAARGFDLYADGIYKKSFTPSYNQWDGDFESLASLGTSEEREITIHFPLYAGVKSLYIGIDEKATLEAAQPYDYDLPVVFYGSSITNGAAASRPGMSYESILSRMLNVDHHNLGFGGSAKGEATMADYVASLDMSAFVLDYDHNAPNVEHLQNTHEPMFRKVREKHPDLPIIIISRPQYGPESDRDRRYEVIKQTYDNAVAAGDKNVYLLRGSEFFDGLSADFTVDGVHPTDLGFFFMAKGIAGTLRDALKK